MADLAPVPHLADPDGLEAALATLELTIRHRVDGLLHGNHLGLVPGPGTEPGEARLYVPGDDVRRMDWAITARTMQPHIRQTIADRELETWLALDLSASMDFGTARCEKRDLAVVAAAVFAQLTSGGGNRIGAVIGTGDGITRVPARAGLVAARQLVRTIARTPRSRPGGRADLRGALEQLRRPPRRAGLVVAISDFLGPLDWQRAMRALAIRHDVLAVSISDPRDLQLPPVGLVTLADPESGRTKQVRTTRELRARFADAAAAQQHEVTAALRRIGVPQLSLSTDRDWIADVLRFVRYRKSGWDGAALSAAGR